MRCAVLLLAVACCSREPSAPPVGELRLVSLTPSATEVIAALGATDKLVGVDDYSKFPPEVARLPKVGSFIVPNLEAIVRLRPSLVIVDDVHGQVAGALHDSGVTTTECPMHVLADVETCLRTVGDKLGKQKEAAAVIADIAAALAAAKAHQPTHHPRVLAVIDREADGLGNIIAAGPGSWVDELLAVAGGDNALAAAGTRYPKIAVEEVLRAQPDVILDLSPAGSLAPWNGLDVPAVKAHRVYDLSGDAHAPLHGPSPRIRAALADLAPLVQ